MTITPDRLIRAAGLAAAAAGIIFIGVQIAHPPMDVASVDSANWVVRSTAKVLMCGLALAGITGLYARQVRQVGVLGLAGYLTFAVAYLLMLPTEVAAAFILPTLSHISPDFTSDVLTAAYGGTPAGDLGLLSPYLAITGLLFMAGGLMLGIAMFRAGIVARWAAALLAIGTVGTMFLAVLPDSFNRPMAIPVGVALIGLGGSLWREQRSDAAVVLPVVSNGTTIR